MGMTPSLIGQARDFLSKGNSKSKGASIGVIGDLALDRYIFGSVDRISPEAPVPVLHVDRHFDKPGCAANVCENLAALREAFQLKVDVLGVVGDDEAGTKLLGQMLGHGKNFELRVVKDPSRPTTLKTRYMAGAQHQLLRVDVEDTANLSAESEKEFLKNFYACIDDLDGLLIQDYAKGLLSEKILSEILRVASEKKIPSLVDPNRNTPGHFYKGATLITPNIAETEILLGRSLKKGENNEIVAEACADLKKNYDLKMAMITRSQHGITLLDAEDQIHHFPAISRAVFDVTGAGDTVMAVFAGAYLSGASIPVACTLATAAASVVVAKVGTATASVQEILDELEHFPTRV